MVGGALWVLYNLVQSIELVDVWNHFRDLAFSSILLALSITALSYFVVTGYDVVALHHIKRKLPYSRVALSAFLASTFGNNMGFALLTGTSIRYRMYSQAGLSALEVAGIGAMCAISTLLGMSFILSTSILLHTGEMHATNIPIPNELLKTVSGGVLSIIFGYLICAWVKPITIHTKNWVLKLPSPGTTIIQIFLATTNLVLIATIVFVLIPNNNTIQFIDFLSVFALAIIAGSVSNIPGGIGVFESVILLGLPDLEAAPLLVSILLFRCIYYIAPLGIATLILAIHEATHQQQRIAQIQEKASDWLDEIGPQLMALIMVLAGVILLLSGASGHYGEQWQPTLPLVVVETAHLLASMAGIGLVIVARGLSCRLDASFLAAAKLLIVGTICALFRDFDFKIAITLVVIFCLLGYTRPEFYRRSSLFDQGFTPKWTSISMVVIALMIWTGFFAHKPIDYSTSLWWYFGENGDLPRFLRSTVAVIAVALIAGLVFFQRRNSDSKLDQHHRHELIKRIIKTDSSIRANLAIANNKRILFSASSNAFLMYQIKDRNWIALSDPVGAKSLSEHKGLLLSFRELCDRSGAQPVFFLIDSAHKSYYVDLNMSLIKIGYDARILLEQFRPEENEATFSDPPLENADGQQLRFEIVNPNKTMAILPKLRKFTAHWEKSQSGANAQSPRGYFNEFYFSNFPIAVVYQGNQLVAFANILTTEDNTEVGVDFIRFGPQAPDGIIDYLHVQLMLWGRHQGYRWFNLGLTPLKNVSGHPLEPLWNTIGHHLYQQSEHFKTIAELRDFVDQFDPHLQSKYLALPNGLHAPRILSDIAELRSCDRALQNGVGTL